ncbi:hypothetical protein GQ44DRAFT_399140 [Phaeosphaeriaceae sp. PMI808]|nr:hypothetical protein GQ44DRAFT_399140 [Phaeosphaeriaceae sp. PMI808]
MAPLVKTPRRRLTYQERLRIYALRHNAGWSLPKISSTLGIPFEIVRRRAKIDLFEIKKYTSNMNERCQAVLQAEAEHTRY